MKAASSPPFPLYPLRFPLRGCHGVQIGKPMESARIDTPDCGIAVSRRVVPWAPGHSDDLQNQGGRNDHPLGSQLRFGPSPGMSPECVGCRPTYRPRSGRARRRERAHGAARAAKPSRAVRRPPAQGSSCSSPCAATGRNFGRFGAMQVPVRDARAIRRGARSSRSDPSRQGTRLGRAPDC
jgi:hypothetical protein